MGTATLTVEELNRELTHASLRVVDCRFQLSDPAAGRRAFAAGHIPGAVYAHLDDDLSGTVRPGKTGRHPLPDPEVLADTLGAWGIDSTTRVVAYDDDAGAIAARLWWTLRWLGHSHVGVLNGGIRAWQAAGLPLSTEPPGYVRARFVPRPRSELLATAQEVDAVRLQPDWRVFDARALERFRGEVEPVDPVAGHIPGAVSLPFAGNLRDGCLLSQADLSVRYGEAMQGTPPNRCIAYCGSGVTACHLVLAAEAAGLPGVRLYAGSWSEWIVDPDRPVATG